MFGTVSEGDPGLDHEFLSAHFGRHRRSSRRSKELVIPTEGKHGAEGGGFRAELVYDAHKVSTCLLHPGSDPRRDGVLPKKLVTNTRGGYSRTQDQ